MKKLTSYHQRGQALVLIALAAVGLFAFAALAIDGSLIYSDRRHAQNAADTAVLAAALSKTRGGDWEQAGLDRATSNGYNWQDPSKEVDMYLCSWPDADCGLPAYARPDEYIKITIKSDVKLFFARVIGIQKGTNYVKAIARAIPSDYDEMFYGNAVVGLSPEECRAVTYQGNASTTISGGGIFVMSSCADAAFFNHSTSADLTVPSICAVGGVQYNPDAVNAGSISGGCTPPPAIVEPNPQCLQQATWSGNIMNPGWYVGAHFPPAGVDTLMPGIYCIDADFQLSSGSLTGYGVVLRMNDGKINWNGGDELHLSAPTEGPYEGLLIYLPSSNTPSNCDTITINGNSASTIEGTILAPCSNVTVNGTGDSGIVGQIIGYTVDLGGTSASSIHYDDQHNYTALTQPTVQLSQ